RRTILGRDPQPSSRSDEEGLRHCRLRGGESGAALRRHAARALARRAAAWRHCAGHRPHCDVTLRRGEPARSGLVPDEPARRRPDDGRAVGSLAEAVARAAYPGGEAELTSLRTGKNTGNSPENPVHGPFRGPDRRLKSMTYAQNSLPVANRDFV